MNIDDTDSQSLSVTEINGWRYDFESLPLWKVRGQNPWCTYKLSEDAEHDTACLLYGIIEERMLAYFGYCAVFRNKKDPVCAAAFPGIGVWQQNPTFSKDGQFVLLSTYYTRKGMILVLDLKNEKYALFELPRTTPVKEITEEAPDIFSYRFYETEAKQNPIRRIFGKKLRIGKLKFNSWDAIRSAKSEV